MCGGSRARLTAIFVVIAAIALGQWAGEDAGAGGTVVVGAEAVPDPHSVRAQGSAIRWRPSRALGEPFDGRLVRGVQLPVDGRGYATWDPVLERRPNRGWRRWGTDHLLRVLLRVVRGFRAAHPGAPRLLIGDLSRPRGGDFGPRFGGIGHASHQNGLDVDVYYPRRDRRELAPRSPGQVDLRLSQDLLDRFLRAGPEYVFIGPAVPLLGPRRVVRPLTHHDDHLHLRLYNPVR